MEELLERLERIERKLDEALTLLKSLAGHGFSEEALEGLNWRPYPSGEGEWIFVDEAPQGLVEALRARGGSMVVDGYRYTLREGRAKQFIARKKVEARP